MAGRFEAFLEVTENAHDVSSLDAVSRRGIGRVGAGEPPMLPAIVPQNSNGTWKPLQDRSKWSLPITRKPVCRLSPVFGWPEGKDSSG
ncbi:hypothetical protein D3C78_706660 [compost metagenome]